MGPLELKCDRTPTYGWTHRREGGNSSLDLSVQIDPLFHEKQASALNAIDEAGGIIVLCIGWYDIEATTEVDIAVGALRKVGNTVNPQLEVDLVLF